VSQEKPTTMIFWHYFIKTVLISIMFGVLGIENLWSCI